MYMYMYTLSYGTLYFGTHTHTHTVSEQQLRWAKTEDNPLFLCLFGRLAELSWMGNELLKQFQEKVRYTYMYDVMYMYMYMYDVMYDVMCHTLCTCTCDTCTLYMYIHDLRPRDTSQTMKQQHSTNMSCPLFVNACTMYVAH